MIPGLLWRLALTSVLVYAAWCDWRTRTVPFPLMWALFALGVGGAFYQMQWVVGVMALLAGLISSAPHVPATLRRAGPLVLLGATLTLNPSPDVLSAIALIAGAWWLWEAHLIGGADATFTVALAALFPTVLFAQWVLIAWAGGGLLTLLIRHRQHTWRVLLALSAPDPDPTPRTGLPAVIFLACAGTGYLWLHP